MGQRQVAPGSAAEDLVRYGRTQPRDLQAGRMLSGLAAVLTRLEAAAPWGAILAEQRGAGRGPATPLGEAEAEFWAARGHSRAGAVEQLRRAA
jgi:hypothetical protein